MARRRIGAVPRGGDASGAEKRRGGRDRAKVQMWLPADLVRQLKHEAIERGIDLGALCAEPLRSLVGQRWRPKERTGSDLADGPALRVAETAEPAGSEAAESGEDAA